MLLSVFHAFVALLACRLVFHRRFPAFLDWCLAFALHFVSSIYTLVVAAVAFYLFASFGSSPAFVEYKHILSNLADRSNAEHIALAVLFAITLCECCIIDLAYLFLYQDHRLTLYCSNVWRYKLLDQATKLGLVAAFMLDPANNYVVVTGICLAILFLLKIVLRFWMPVAPSAMISDLADLFYDNSSLLLIVMILVCNVINLWLAT